MVSRMTEPILTYANTEGQGEWMRGWGSTALAPPGATLSGSAERQPSEIPSRTRSVSAFLLSGASMGPRSSGDVRAAPQPRTGREGCRDWGSCKSQMEQLSLPHLGNEGRKTVGPCSSGDVGASLRSAILFTRWEKKGRNGVGKRRIPTGELKTAARSEMGLMALIFHLPQGRPLNGSAPLA